MTDSQQQTPLGVRILEDLVQQLAANTALQTQVLAELKGLREDIRDLAETNEQLGAVLDFTLAVLDQVAVIGVQRPPTWKDVVAIMDQLRNDEDTQPEPSPVSQPIFRK